MIEELKDEEVSEDEIKSFNGNEKRKIVLMGKLHIAYKMTHWINFGRF